MSDQRMPLRIGVVDDHAVVREGIVRILNGDADISIVFQGTSSADAVSQVHAHRPDLLLIDLGIPGSGLEAIRRLRQSHPDLICVAFTANDDPDLAMEVLALGASGFILKGIGGKDLIAALKEIAAGGQYVTPEFATRLMGAAGVGPLAKQSQTMLNHREEQVMKGVEKGLTNRQIAERLKLSEQTIKYYMTGIINKYGVTNRVSALREYQERQSDHNRRSGH